MLSTQNGGCYKFNVKESLGTASCYTITTNTNTIPSKVENITA